MTHANENNQLLLKAKSQMAEDMKAREIGAIIWSVADAGFHYIPEIVVTDPKDGSTRTVRVTGLYLYKDEIYAIEEDKAGISTDEFYRVGVDVPPVVVTLSPLKAEERIGKPTEEKGYTTQGTLEEWVAIADCYFEALNEK